MPSDSVDARTPLSPALGGILITGASRGIGAEIAQHLAALGWAVAINYTKDAEAAQRVAATIRQAGGRAEVVQADVGDWAQASALVQRAAEALGGLRGVVNNAGVYASSTLEQSDAALVRRIMSINFEGVVAVTRAAAPFLAASAKATTEAAGADVGAGGIVNITSVAARAEWGGAAMYCASKAAVEALTRCTSAELGPLGVRVNAVAPGVTETDINRAGLTPQSRERIAGNTALGRVGATGDIAPLVGFLLSPAARWITGQIIDADGGYRA